MLLRIIKSKLFTKLFFISLLLGSPIANAAAVRLQWDSPTTNTDNSPLTDLAGFKIYYGTTSGSYTNSVTIGVINNYVIDLPINTTYYFAATAINLVSVESGYSNEVSKLTSGISTLIKSKASYGPGTYVSSGISVTYNSSDNYYVILDLSPSIMADTNTDITILVERYSSGVWVEDSKARYKGSATPGIKGYKSPTLFTKWEKTTPTTQLRVSVSTSTSIDFGITLEVF